MALTSFQRELIQLLSSQRRASGESYVAGGTALNTLLSAPRLSRDIDLFHDSREAVHRSFAADLVDLVGEGYKVDIQVDRDGYIEAIVSQGNDVCRVEWARDSAFRFFPLVEHSLFGLALHPFDLATNKVLALVGRAEPRDWIDVITCDRHLQPLGYLVWAAAGKDPGLNPRLILDQAARTARYTDAELEILQFEVERPSAAAMMSAWAHALDQARQIVELLPAEFVGSCVHDAQGDLINHPQKELAMALQSQSVRFHQGSLFGAFPNISNL